MRANATCRLLATVPVIAAVAAVAATVAGAANLAPNPGFEACSSGAAPTGWVPLASTTITCDPLLKNAGSWGMDLVGAQRGMFAGGGGADSTCITTGISGGSAYTLSGAYSTTDANASIITLRVLFYSDASCGTYIAGGDGVVFTSSPVRTGAWQTLTTTVAAPNGAQSAVVAAEILCGVCTTGTTNSAAAVFDDVALEANSVAAVFRSLTASRAARGVSVRWRVASEVGLIGFNVYRVVRGQRVRANAHVIPATGRRAYSYVDRSPSRRYWVQAVRSDGSEAWFGPAIAR